MDGKTSITYGHFDRSEASGEIFGNVIINSSLKDFSTTLEMTTVLSKLLNSSYINTQNT